MSDPKSSTKSLLKTFFLIKKPCNLITISILQISKSYVGISICKWKCSSSSNSFDLTVLDI